MRAWREVVTVGATVAVLAGCASATTSPTVLSTPSTGPSVSKVPADGRLTVGTLAPQTGPLAFLGPAQAAGVRLATQRINAAGGVLGAPVELVEGDAGATGSDTASRTLDRELAVGVDAIVGPPSSTSAAALLPAATAAQVLVVSPSATAAGLTATRFGNLFARTVAPDTAQANVLASMLADDARSKVCVLATDDDYGRTMAQALAASSPPDANHVVVYYDPGATNFAGPAGTCAAAAPDAVVLVGVESSAKVVAALLAASVGPPKVALYVTDGAVSSATGDGLPAGALAGVKGVVPGAVPDADFTRALSGVDPHLESTDFAAESFDAATMIALAAVIADSDAGPAMAAALPKVSSTDAAAVSCATFADCVKALGAGKPINYQGVSGPVDLTAAGQPALAPVGVYVFDASGPHRVSTVMASSEPKVASASPSASAAVPAP